MRRPLLIAALVAATIPALGAHAATTPKPTVVITDPAGDAKYGDDITAVSINVTKKAGALDKLIFDVTFAKAPTFGVGTSFNFQANVTGCGDIYWYTYWSASDLGAVSTGSIGSCDAIPTVEVKGNVMTYTISTKAFGVKVGTAFSDFVVFTELAEPVLGEGPADILLGESGALDWSQGATSYKVK